MKQIKNMQLEYGPTPIGTIEICPDAQDDIPANLKGFQHLYLNQSVREQVLAVHSERVGEKASHRVGCSGMNSGMKLWRILTLGILKQGLAIVQYCTQQVTAALTVVLIVIMVMPTVVMSHGESHFGEHPEAKANHCLSFEPTGYSGTRKLWGQHIYNYCSKIVFVAYGGDQSYKDKCINYYSNAYPCVGYVDPASEGKRGVATVTGEANVYFISCFSDKRVVPYYEEELGTVGYWDCYHPGRAPAGFRKGGR